MDKEKLQHQYFEALTNGANLDEICEITAKACGLPVALALPTRTLIAHSSDYSEKLIAEYMYNLEMCDEEEIKEMYMHVQDQVMTQHAVVDIYRYLTYKHVVCGCFMGQMMYAVVDCQMIKKCDLDDAKAIIEMSAPVFMTALRIHQYVNADTSCPMQIYLLGLLNGNDQNWFQQRNLYNSPIETVHSWQLFWCFPAQPEQNRQRKNKLDLFCKSHRDIWYVEHDNGLVGIFNAQAEGLLEEVVQLCSDVTPIGVSNPFTELKDVVENLHYAQMALRMLLFEERTERVAFVSDYKIMIYVLSVKPTPESIEKEQLLIEQIKKYDELHESEYYKTICAWLFCSMDYKKMASRLFVHKNTIVYRMQRIQELFGIDFNDCRTITNLYLSIYLEFA